jgi:hypothetical protein
MGMPMAWSAKPNYPQWLAIVEMVSVRSAGHATFRTGVGPNDLSTGASNVEFAPRLFDQCAILAIRHRGRACGVVNSDKVRLVEITFEDAQNGLL